MIALLLRLCFFFLGERSPLTCCPPPSPRCCSHQDGIGTAPGGPPEKPPPAAAETDAEGWVYGQIWPDLDYPFLAPAAAAAADHGDGVVRRRRWVRQRQQSAAAAAAEAAAVAAEALDPQVCIDFCVWGGICSTPIRLVVMARYAWFIPHPPQFCPHPQTPKPHQIGSRYPHLSVQSAHRRVLGVVEPGNRLPLPLYWSQETCDLQVGRAAPLYACMCPPPIRFRLALESQGCAARGREPRPV